MMTHADDMAPSGLISLPKAPLSSTEKSELIDATQWANEFSYAHVKKLARYMDVYRLETEQVLFYEGDRQAYLVLIAKGEVNVVKTDSSRKPHVMATLGPGKTIGEMSLIDGEPRSASAVTATPATVLVMTTESFNRLNDDLPRVGILLVLKIAKLISQYLRQTSGRLIERLE